MQSLLHLLASDLRRMSKTPGLVLLWLAFPLVLSAIEYGAFGQLGRSGTGLPKGTLLLVDRDRSTASGMFVGALRREPLVDFFEVVTVDSMPQAESRLLDNQGTAALVLPVGFQDSILTGGPVELVYAPNPRETIRPQMVHAALDALLEVGNRFLHEADAAIDQLRAVADVDDPGRETVMSIAGSFYDAQKRFERLSGLEDLDIDLKRPAPRPEAGPTSSRFNFFAYFLPGLLLFSVLQFGQGSERRFFHQRQIGLARRVDASPIGRGTVLAAESLGILAGTLITGAIILACGFLLFRIPMRQLDVLALTLLGFGLYVIGLVKTIYARAKSKRTAEMVGSIVILLTTLLGGGFAPAEIYPASVRPIAVASPVGCAGQAMVEALVHGRTLGETLPHVAATWAWGLGLLAVGLALSWRPRARA
jgi:ABC-type multidrug transport system permease subunit